MSSRRTAALSFAFLLVAALSEAQIGLVGAPDDVGAAHVTLNGNVMKVNGDEVEGVIDATIANTWHINSAKPLDEYLIATVLSFTNADLIHASFPAHEEKTFAFSAGAKVAVYEGTIKIPFVAKLHPGAKSLHAVLKYQACNDRVCLPPKTAELDVSLKPGEPAIAPVPPSPGFTRLADAPKNVKPKASLFSNDIKATFASHGLALTLLAIFVLGLALNLTPCVYPLIPITSGYFSNQSGGSRAYRAALSVVYVLGIAITYSALGVFAALSSKLFGAWLQLPAVLIFFALLMLVMASSMFGLFEIKVPHFITDRSGGRAGLVGALTMGLLIGVVAAPCVGPFVVSLIALVTSLGSPLLGFLMFFVLALGLGFPYLVLGIFWSTLSSIPRAGMWMVQVKRGMGFILIAMAFYFLRPLIGDAAFRWGVAGSLLVGAAFLFAARAPGARVLRIAIASLLLVAGVAFAIPQRTGAVLRWDRYDAKVIEAARVAHQPVIIDFYADWCLPCKELDEKTFSDPKVSDELQRFVRVKADLTATNDPNTIALSKKYAVVGVPTIVFIDGAGNERDDLRLTGFEDPAKFVARAAQVR